MYVVQILDINKTSIKPCGNVSSKLGLDYDLRQVLGKNENKFLGSLCFLKPKNSKWELGWGQIDPNNSMFT